MLKSIGPQACSFIKKENLAQVFPVNLAKFLRTPSLREHLRWLRLKYLLQERMFLYDWLLVNCSILIAKHEVYSQLLIHDKFAIGLVNSDLVTVCHIPRFLFKLTYFFLKRGGHIKCKITGVKKYSNDLEQVILEIPAGLTITNANKTMTWKKNMNPVVQEYRKINRKPK